MQRYGQIGFLKGATLMKIKISRVGETVNASFEAENSAEKYQLDALYKELSSEHADVYRWRCEDTMGFGVKIRSL
jgi:hypothetical protein